MSDLIFIGTAEGVDGRCAVFQEHGQTFRLSQASLELRIRNLRANDSYVSPEEILALDVLKSDLMPNKA